MVCVYYQIFGRVQGVGFRYFTLRTARELGIKGWVRNAVDGSVEVLAVGSQHQLLLFERELRKGPSFSHVIQLKRFERACEEDFDQFRILP
ncbi:MAG: acylphosphatase [Acidobacteria bacterium]|nr:MAG: acylphosphatase [Acidobacteriota bacterium]